MSNTVKANLLAFLTVLIWGAGFPFTRAIGDEISPYSLVFIRCLVGFLVLAVIGYKKRVRKAFTKKHHLYFFIQGLLGFSLYLVFFNLGNSLLDSATASVITATCPIFTAIGAMKIYREPINILGWTSIGGAFIGVLILLLWDNGLSLNWGAIWIFALSILFAIYNLLARHLTDIGYTSTEIVVYATMWAAVQSVFFAPGAIRDLGTASAPAIVSAVMLGIFATALAYYFWNTALSLTQQTSKIANYIFLNSPIATVIAFFLLGEIPTPATIIGSVVIIGFVVLFSLRGTKQETVSEVSKS